VPALTDGAARLLVVLLTAGNVHDSTMFGQLLSALRVAHAGPGRPRTRQDYLIADRGYSSRANRGLLRARGIGQPSRRRPIRPAIAAAKDRLAADHPASTATATPAATALNAASASSTPATAGYRLRRTRATTLAQSTSPRYRPDSHDPSDRS
jgi:hypothetical protein